MNHFRARLTRFGPFVPIRVWYGAPMIDGETLDRAHRWQCLIGTSTTGVAIFQLADGGWPVEVDGPALRSIEPITPATYAYMMAHASWARAHSPEHPSTKPRQAVDFGRIKLPF